MEIKLVRDMEAWPDRQEESQGSVLPGLKGEVVWMCCSDVLENKS